MPKRHCNMRIFVIILISLIFGNLNAQRIKNTKSSLIGKLIKNDGTLLIQTRYSIGEAGYSEEFINIQKTDSVLIVSVSHDSSSYFKKFKKITLTDTSFIIPATNWQHFVDLEKQIFKKGIQPTYNCDGENGAIVHNMTNIIFIYTPDKSYNSVKNFDIFSNSNMPKDLKIKAINIMGGFVSMGYEIKNIGIDSSHCLTNWWDD